MCLIASLYEQRKQKKAAEKAHRQAKAASANSQARADAEKTIASAQEAAEAQTIDAPETSDLSNAMRRRGVSSTYLNQTLG